nr:MAG TPA: hypothetical protein [Caudoviricetes sp.]
MNETGLLNDWANEKTLFYNGQGGELSRKTIAVVIKNMHLKRKPPINSPLSSFYFHLIFA